MSEAFAKFAEAKQKIAAARAEATKVARDAFNEGAKILFDANPTLESFGWEQYTPYFNDGDECTFSAHTDEPNVNGRDGYDFYGEEPETKASKKLQGIVYRDFLKHFDDESLKELFGDHTRVTVKRDGEIETDGYDHD